MKELKEGNIIINAQYFSDWFKKHYKLANADIVCDLLKIIDTSELTVDLSSAELFNQDISKWNTE